MLCGDAKSLFLTRGKAKVEQLCVLNRTRMVPSYYFIFILSHFMPAHNRTAINKVVLYTSLYNTTVTFKVQFICRCWCQNIEAVIMCFMSIKHIHLHNHSRGVKNTLAWKQPWGMMKSTFSCFLFNHWKVCKEISCAMKSTGEISNLWREFWHK